VDYGRWWWCFRRILVRLNSSCQQYPLLTGLRLRCRDAIAAHGFADELANYGEYSGAPTENQTYEYAKTIRESRRSQRLGFVPKPY
jgi:hypothetical protein